MTPDQILALFTNGVPNAIGYVLFLYLFWDTRKESAELLKSTRDETKERVASIKQESEQREMWFRQAVEKQQANDATMAESLRRLVEKIETMDSRLQRIEARPTRRSGE